MEKYEYWFISRSPKDLARFGLGTFAFLYVAICVAGVIFAVTVTVQYNKVKNIPHGDRRIKAMENFFGIK
jgi:hypothetical protein